MTADRYAVIGNPVEHSKSPRIHQLFAEQTGQKLSYEKILAPLHDFAATVTRFQAEGGRGINITLPFKIEALDMCEVASDRARRAGAVNTISFEPDEMRSGDNTDGVGLVRDLSINHGIRLDGLRVLLLGAGGAVRGALGPLLDTQPASVTIANRTLEKARELAANFGMPEAIEACDFAGLEELSFDVIINGTSAGVDGQMPVLPTTILTPGGTCYDMFYGDEPTAFLNWGAARGAGILADGLGMLVEQAAESFLIWRGVRPETLPVLRELRGRG